MYSPTHDIFNICIILRTNISWCMKDLHVSLIRYNLSKEFVDQGYFQTIDVYNSFTEADKLL